MVRLPHALEALRRGADHEAARQHLEQLGWTICGRGDWAIALRSPDGSTVARISPFDPTAPFTAELYREGTSTGWFPRLDLELHLDGGASLLLMEYLRPVEVTAGIAVHTRLRNPDPGIARAAALIRHHHRRAVAALPWCGPIDSNPSNILQAADGTLRITDPYYADGPALYATIASDPTRVARAIAPTARRHILDIPLASSGGWNSTLREEMRIGLARADDVLASETP